MNVIVRRGAAGGISSTPVLLVALCVVLGMTASQAIAQTKQGDSPPAWPSDGCGYWESTPGFAVFFLPGQTKPFDPERAKAILDEFAQHWREGDRGYMLLAGHIDGAEAAQQPTDLDERRAYAVRDELIARGIPGEALWTKGMGFSQPLAPTAMGVADPQNRRVTLRNTLRGEACVHERRGIRIEWFSNNCFPKLTSTVEACNKQLKNIHDYDGY